MIYPVFLVTYVMMIMTMPMTAGKYLLETTSAFAASVFFMTNQRFPAIFLFFLVSTSGVRKSSSYDLVYLALVALYAMCI